MILIKNIETIEIDRDPVEILKYNNPFQPVPVNGNTAMEPIEVIKEFVHGRLFCRPSDGKEINLGMTKQAQDVIGIQFEAWEYLENLLSECRNYANMKNQQIEKIKSATFWKRLKWLFYGYSR